MKYNNVEIRDKLPDERPRLPEEIKVKWIAALRSGLFPQGDGALCRDALYCCLGVLSLEQGRLVRGDGRWCDGDIHSVGNLSSSNPLNEILNANGNLAVAVLLTTETETIRCLSLVSLNDAGATFHEIAWVIEIVF